MSNQVIYKFLALFWGQLTTSNSKGLWTWSDKFVSNFCCHMQLAATLEDENMSGTGGNP